ncbi:MAG: helix-turn-helix domain-containing protein [Liquorilactobacillus ghanensis]|uniref:helix-turn-helix domain-containing protein n=1 Tax=Liquorilactobacillus ghanensis TaxID=399370 RepID=UPI0039EBF3DE
MSLNYKICSLLYASFYIPIIYVQNQREILFTFPPTIKSKKEILTLNKYFDSNKNPSLFLPESEIIYGKIKIRDNKDYIIIGPVINDSFTPNRLDKDFNLSQFDLTEIHNIAADVFSPKFNLNSFSNFLILTNYLINKKMLTTSKHFQLLNTHVIKNINTQKTKQKIHKVESNNLHNTYFLEQEMLNYIRRGQKENLINFLENKMSKSFLHAGKMGETPLRQTKNIFIGTLVKVGNLAAIPGGMAIEDVYELIDNYTIKCEKLSSVDQILALQYNMLIDFCQLIKNKKISTVSVEVQRMMNFIDGRVNTTTTIADVAKFCNRSNSYVGRTFKKETGKTIHQYILEAKLIEGQNLLTYTDMTIAEISNYLNFSSQSYFQNCFRKYFEVTPFTFRRNSSA